METTSFQDATVQETAQDAADSRQSACLQGYFEDPFACQFVRRPIRRSPVVNRGTYCRFIGLHSVLRKFLASCRDQGRTSQVVSLGAGSDTTFFLLHHLGLAPTRFFEVDFPEVTSRKCLKIHQKKALRNCLDQDTVRVGQNGTELYSPGYTLLSGDLRHFLTDLGPRLLAQGLDPTVPTLFLSECVLIYLESPHADNIIRWAATHLSSTFFLKYEQIRPEDAFGKMMIRNLRQRGLELRGITAYPDLASQAQRYRDLGWDHSQALSIREIYHALPKNEIDRINRLEMLDELEEFDLLGDHYCITWAFKTSDTELRRTWQHIRPTDLSS
ncbi:carboxy methyl transferase for protein phosphatase 2A [Dispira simplex]|nr:carboxy methyl transferase for protein phosphatase 2A [Dispira simplex]